MNSFRNRIAGSCILFSALSAFGAVAGDFEQTFSGKEPVTGKMVYEPKVVLEPNVTSPRFQWGFDTDVRWDSNIFLAQEGFEQEGFTYTASPDFLYRLFGDEFTEHMLVAGYSPTFYYDDISTDLNDNHDASILYRFNSARTTATLTGRYSHVDGNNGRDFGASGEALFLREQRRNSSDRYSVIFDVDYAVSELLDLDVRSGYNRTTYSALNDYTIYGSEVALLYGGRQAITRFGPFVGYERVESDGSPTQDALQFGGRVDWRYSALTSFFGQLGVDTRDYEGAGTVGSTDEVIWAVGARWTPDEMLTAELTLDRKVAPSITNVGQNFTISSASAAVRKEFMGQYFGRLVGSYSWVDYNATLAAAATARDDSYYSSYVEVGRELADYGELSLFYNFLENDSSLAPFSFNNHTVGLKLGVSF